MVRKDSKSKPVVSSPAVEEYKFEGPADGGDFYVLLSRRSLSGNWIGNSFLGAVSFILSPF
jgi:hypothetical protein